MGKIFNNEELNKIATGESIVIIWSIDDVFMQAYRDRKEITSNENSQISI